MRDPAASVRSSIGHQAFLQAAKLSEQPVQPGNGMRYQPPGISGIRHMTQTLARILYIRAYPDHRSVRVMAEPVMRARPMTHFGTAQTAQRPEHLHRTRMLDH